MMEKNNKNPKNISSDSEYIWVHKEEIRSLYSKIVEYENKIIIYKELIKKNVIVDEFNMP